MEGLPIVASTADDLKRVVERARRATRVAVDLEANGRFAYRARLSMIQLAFDDEVALVDPLAPGLVGQLTLLASLLAATGPVKVIHDVGYDARLLADVGLPLANVHDTALAAQWLGRASTGLAALALSELGVTLDKSLQAQNWAARPLTERSLHYLAADVKHLLALDDRLWAEAVTGGIVSELFEETSYRIAGAERSVREPDPRPPFTRVKGAEKLRGVELAVLRRVARAREDEAERLDTPAGELLPSGVLVAIAERKPGSRAELAQIRGATARLDPARVAEALVAAVRAGLQDGDVPEDEKAWLSRDRLPPAVIKARRDRESRLSTWRRLEAKQRGVHEQVVLPGHCASDLVDSAPLTLERLSQVPGLGAFRVERYGAALVQLLEEPAPP